MKLGFEESQATYDSGSQQARVWTERWVADWMFCPNCGSPRLNQFPANSPLADFFCPACSDQYEVKAKNGRSFGKSVADGAYATKIARLTSNTNPNLLLLWLRQGCPRGSERLCGAEALLRARDHSTPKATEGNRASGWLGWIEHPARPGTGGGTHLRPSRRPAGAKGRHSDQVAANPVPAGSERRGPWLVARRHEGGRGDWTIGVLTR